MYHLLYQMPIYNFQSRFHPVEFEDRERPANLNYVNIPFFILWFEPWPTNRGYRLQSDPNLMQY
jgi:hypothetical protein